MPKNGKTSSEIIWVPHFAGNRTINIYADIDNDIPEVFEVLNNEASVRDLWVYFFFDDLEDGSGNWHHDATITRINAESTLEYMDDPVHSNINGTWNWSDSHGFGYNTTDWHSYNGFYYTLEPGGTTKLSLDIVLSLDTSGSMSGTPINDLKTAAINFINLPMLDSNDRVAIYGFYNEAPRREQVFTVCDDAGKTSLISTINGLSANGYTPLWDTIGESVNYIKNQGSTRTPIVIAMTDGEDYGNQGREDGSETYCPWHKWDGGSIQYHNVDTTSGHDHFTYDGGGNPSTESNWLWENLDDEWRDGLLNIADVSVYTVGLGLQHNNHTGDSCWRFPNGWMGAFAPYESVEHSWSTNRNSTIYGESGTPEYGLWRVANTSGAEYFYADESSKLNTIFQTIAQSIAGSGATSRSAHDSSRSRAEIYSFDFESGWQNWAHAGAQDEWERGNPSDPPLTPHSGSSCIETDLNGNYNDNANNRLYRDIDLTGYSNCQMTFWHYFEMENNYDGGCVMVSNNGGTTWSLAAPNLPSSGWDTNINGNNKYLNDLGHRSGWTGNHPMGDNTWEQVTIDLSTYDGESITIRFWMSSDGGTTDDGWAIDDIIITGDTSGIDNSELFLPGDRNLTTYSFSLENVSSAKISFYHKYNLLLGLNGVVVLIGTPNGGSGEWMYEYTSPKQPYTGNFDLSKCKYDNYGNEMLWCWNGISGNNLFNWDYTEISLDNWTGLPEVRVRLHFLWSTWAANGVYMLDDFEIKVEHSDEVPMEASSSDQWQLITSESQSGNFSWWNGNPVTNNFTGGLDNSLYTRPIDITNARNATLSAYLKFNINTAAGRPPDGFRVEISKDNAVTWIAINLGVRSAWGVSGNDTDDQDGAPNDGKSYTGIDTGDNWVEAGSLTRLNCDLSGWAGEVIRLRFRVVTASDANPFFGSIHYESSTAGFGGFYIDDIIVYGFSLLE